MNVKALSIVWVIVVGIFGISMSAFKIVVPKAVEEAFAKKYPTAQNVEWETEDESEEGGTTVEYEAEFMLEGSNKSATFKADGTWVETESKISIADLPAAVTAAIADQFTGYAIQKAKISEKPDFANVYKIKLENKDTEAEVKAVFSESGELLKKEIKEENDEENNDEEEDEDNGGN